MFGFWVNSWLLGRFLVDFWPLVRFLDCGTIFDFSTIFGFWDDFWLFGRFLSFWLIFGFCVNSSLLGRFLVDIWPLVRFLAFGRIFNFLDDFCHLG